MNRNYSFPSFIEGIMDLIRKGESEIVEVKKTTGSLRGAIETICAFANHKGGYLIFGVDDSGKVLGMQATDDTLKNIANAVKLNTDPRLYPSIEAIELEGKTCILVTVEESPLKPHLAYGRAFLRVGTSNQKIDREKYEYLLRQRFNGYGFDYRIEQKACLDDIDTDVLYEFLETANSVRNLNENLMLPAEMILEKLDLMTVIREALANMIVHRDYRQNVKSTVEVRPSQISFYNPALLFEPTITVTRLKSLHPSRPGNRLIAKVFYLMGLFENWGGGTLKILSESTNAGKPEPAFFFEGGMFRLVLYR
jgi:predicted HTH transcriptional regulator